MVLPSNMRRMVGAMSQSYMKQEAKPNNQARQKSWCITDFLFCPNRLLQGGQGHKISKMCYCVS